ncbi:hypothetical protein HYY75_10485, partial [bacterium]|nr:hypothetical protein [bacterium]
TIATEIDLRSELTPVKHQGQRGTCSVFAATTLMEFLLDKEKGARFDLSEAFNYYLGKTKALDTPYVKKIYNDGENLAGYLAVRAYMFGCMQESEWPYETQNWLQTGNPNCHVSNGNPDLSCYIGAPPKGAKELPFRIIPIFITPDKISEFLLKSKKPVVYNLLWCQDAVNNQTGVFRLPTKEELKKAAGHVILLVGYDSEAKLFYFRNCWGKSWGAKGYGTLPEEYVLRYGEVSQFKPFEQYPKEVKEFLEIASMGVSGTLDD